MLRCILGRIAEGIPTVLDTVSAGKRWESSPVGLAEVHEEERQELSRMLDRVLLAETGYIGCTPIVKHAIIVETAHLMKQKYYPVFRRKCTSMFE